jgi:membrane protein
MVAGVCFLLLVSLTASAVITAVGGYLKHRLPDGNVPAWTIHLVLDISIVTLLFAMIFKFLPDAKLSWRDVRLGAALTAALFLEVLQLCRSALISWADMVLASSVAGLFKWRQFEPEVILLAVGWYLRFSLS